MMWEDKIWGRVWHLFQSDQAATSFLFLKKGTYCSKHYHEERVNVFAVIRGEVAIEVWFNTERQEPDLIYYLAEGQSYEVLHQLVHRFRVLEDSEMVEVYYPGKEGGKVRFDDIVRLEEGGVE
jgi:mannose-6-phosphate isomerase-like protein (cupin superfamily)